MLTSTMPSLRLAIAVLRCQIRICTLDLDLNLPGNVLTHKKSFLSVASYNLVLLTHTLAIMSPPAALRTRPQSIPATNQRIRRSGEDRQKQRHNRGRRRQQHAAKSILRHEEGDSRLQPTPNLLLLVPAQSNGRKRKRHRNRRYMHCL